MDADVGGAGWRDGGSGDAGAVGVEELDVVVALEHEHRLAGASGSEVVFDLADAHDAVVAYLRGA